MTTISQAVAKKEEASPTALVRQYKSDFKLVLPSHINHESWVRLVEGVIRRNPKLAEAASVNPGSLMVALIDAARQGLEPGTEQFYLATRKIKGKPAVQGLRGYQGEIELIYRAGAVSSVVVDVVRENDGFEFRRGVHERPVHDIDWTKTSDERGPLMLAYAYATMKDGATSQVIVLNKTHIASARESSASAKFDDSPWNKHEEAMWLKTAIHRLHKFVPSSAEYIREQHRAKAEAERVREEGPAGPLPPLPTDDDVVDGEVVDSVSGPPANEDATAPAEGWPAVAEPGSAQQPLEGAA